MMNTPTFGHAVALPTAQHRLITSNSVMDHRFSGIVNYSMTKRRPIVMVSVTYRVVYKKTLKNNVNQETYKDHA